MGKNIFWQFRRKNTIFEKKIIKRYLRTHAVSKLQVGCGGQIRPDWLNANFESWRKGTIFLDATKPFPIEDGQFDFVFSEHMIEHITHAQGLLMLSECFRVLKPGGVIRLSTPDLQFLVNLYRKEKSSIEEAYIEWAVEAIPGVLPSCESAFVVNNFVRDWGHTFIYDAKTLELSLENVGFTRIMKLEINQSHYPELTGMESESRMPEGFLKLESIVVEGEKAK